MREGTVSGAGTPPYEPPTRGGAGGSHAGCQEPIWRPLAQELRLPVALLAGTAPLGLHQLCQLLPGPQPSFSLRRARRWWEELPAHPDRPLPPPRAPTGVHWGSRVSRAERGAGSLGPGHSWGSRARPAPSPRCCPSTRAKIRGPRRAGLAEAARVYQTAAGRSATVNLVPLRPMRLQSPGPLSLLGGWVLVPPVTGKGSLGGSLRGDSAHRFPGP